MPALAQASSLSAPGEPLTPIAERGQTGKRHGRAPREPSLPAPNAARAGRTPSKTMATLYTYQRSQASFRIGSALSLDGLGREAAFLHLEPGDQFAAADGGWTPR
jgi:hypothetical protein